MPNPSSDDNKFSRREKKFNRRELLQAGGALAALSILGARPTFALPVKTGDSKTDTYIAVALARAFSDQPPTSATVTTDPSKLKPIDIELADRRLNALAYAAYFSEHFKDHPEENRQQGLDFLNNIARGGVVDPNDVRLAMGKGILFGRNPKDSTPPSYIPQMSPEAAKSADFLSDYAISAIGIANDSLGLALAGGKAIIKDPEILNSIGKLGGLQYGDAKLGTDYLREQASVEATARAYALGLDFKRDELKDFKSQLGIDFSASLGEHIDNLPESLRGDVKAACDKTNGVLTKKDGKKITDKIIKDLSGKIGGLRDDLDGIKNAIKEEKENVTKAEEAKNKQIELQNKAAKTVSDIKSAAYLCTWLAQNYLDKDSADAVSKYVAAGVSIATASMDPTLGPLQWTALGVSIFSSLTSPKNHLPEEQTKLMLGQMSKYLEAFRKENFEQHVITRQMLGVVTTLQYQTLDRLIDLAKKYSEGTSIIAGELDEIKEMVRTNITLQIDAAKSTKNTAFEVAYETLRTEKDERSANNNEVTKAISENAVQRAMESVYILGKGTNEPSAITRGDVNAAEGGQMVETINSLHHVADAVGIIPSIYKDSYSAPAKLANPLDLALAMVIYGNALEDFPGVETPTKEKARGAKNLQATLKDTIKVLVEATDLENVKKLCTNYTKDAQELYHLYLDKAYDDFLKKISSNNINTTQFPPPGAPFSDYLARKDADIYRNDDRFLELNADVSDGISGEGEFMSREDHVRDITAREDTSEFQKSFGIKSGHAIFNIAQNYGLIHIDQVPGSPVEDRHERMEKGKREDGLNYLHTFYEQKTYYNITFREGKFAGKSVKICSTEVSEGVKGEKRHIQTIVSLANDSRSIKSTDGETVKLDSTKDFLEVLSKEMVGRHAKLREEFLAYVQDPANCSFDNVKALLPNLAKKVDKIQAQGLRLRYLAALRYWLDTGDATTATSLAKYGKANKKLRGLQTIPLFPNDFVELNFFNQPEQHKTGEPIVDGFTANNPRHPHTEWPTNICDDWKKENDPIIETYFNNAVIAAFPPTAPTPPISLLDFPKIKKPVGKFPERIVNVPEIAIAELSMAGSLAAVEKRDKDNPGRAK
jgi:hypothetical protein